MGERDGEEAEQKDEAEMFHKGLFSGELLQNLGDLRKRNETVEDVLPSGVRESDEFANIEILQFNGYPSLAF